MCASSYIGDYARDFVPNRYSFIPSAPGVHWPPLDTVPRAEFEKLRLEVEELKKLLAAAQQFDVKTGQHECEQAEKIAFLKKLAEFVGVDLTEVLR